MANFEQVAKSMAKGMRWHQALLYIMIGALIALAALLPLRVSLTGSHAHADSTATPQSKDDAGKGKGVAHLHEMLHAAGLQDPEGPFTN